jgi:Domain of unknown function (DUF4395)
VRTLFSFPNPVNEKAARFVAFVVMLIAVAILVFDARWLFAVLAYGFVARALTGPTLSPLGTFAMKVAGPRLGPPSYVPGPPKRFAQSLGAAMAVTACVLWFGFGAAMAADVIAVLFVVFAGLESLLAFCVGCQIFALGMRLGIVPERICEECANIGLRPRPTRP